MEFLCQLRVEIGSPAVADEHVRSMELEPGNQRGIDGESRCCKPRQRLCELLHAPRLGLPIERGRRHDGERSVTGQGPAFLDRLADHGFDGLILPDADLDATASIRDRAEALDLAFTTLIAPDTATERAARIAADAREFVYVLARRGLTGARTDAPDLTDRMTQLRALTDLPLAAGFGISTADHVAAVLEHADGAIVGSALVGVMDQASAAGSDAVEAASGLVASMAASVGPSVD